MGIISKEKKDNNIVELEVSVGAEELKAATDRAFRKKVKSISVPGFRKGKAPRQIIEKMYGDSMFVEDAVNELYPKAYSDAIDEAGIDPVDKADVEITKIDKETGFTFKALVTVKPEVELKGYKGVKADKIIYAVSDESVNAEIERMRDRNARIISVSDRAAIDGDSVVIDFEGFVDGVPFEGGKAEGYSITLGSHSFIDTFEQQIEGHNAGDEFDVNVKFPEEYHAEGLKGKPALFKVKLIEIKGKELPELDDEFAKDVSEFDTLDELKADLRAKQEHANSHRTDDELETKLLDEVLKGFKADIPACMFDTRINDMVQDFEYRLSSQGMNLDIYLQYTGMSAEAFRDSFREPAERQVKIRLALEKIAELEKLEASKEDLDAEYKKIAENYKLDDEKVRSMIPEKDLASDIKSNKAIDFVRDNAVITEASPEAEKPAKKAAKPAKKETKSEDKEAKPEKKEAKTETAAKKPAAKKPAAKKTAKKAEE